MAWRLCNFLWSFKQNLCATSNISIMIIVIVMIAISISSIVVVVVVLLLAIRVYLRNQIVQNFTFLNLANICYICIIYNIHIAYFSWSWHMMTMTLRSVFICVHRFIYKSDIHAYIYMCIVRKSVVCVGEIPAAAFRLDIVPQYEFFYSLWSK